MVYVVLDRMYDYVHLYEMVTVATGFMSSSKQGSWFTGAAGFCQLHTWDECVLRRFYDLPGDLQLFSPNRVNSL